MEFLIYPLFAASGLLALIYQVVWLRELALVFGSTTYSVSVILSSYMAGIAAGAAFFGKLATSSKRPLKSWARLEFLTGASALLSLLVLSISQKLYELIAYGTETLTPSIILLKIVFALLLVFPTTFFIGGTLPYLIRFLGKTRQVYFVNTFGSFLGVLISAFILIEILGLKNLLIITAFMNIFLSILIYFFLSNKTKKKPEKQLKTSQNFAIKNRENSLVITVFFFSGALSLSYEVLWTRLLTPSAGTYVYAFAIIVAVVIFGIAVGSLLEDLIISKLRNKVFAYSLLEWGIAASATASLIILALPLKVTPVIKLSFVVFPTSFLMGIKFPLVASLYKGASDEVKKISQAYAANVGGSIIGPVITGFILVPYLGVTHTFLALVSINFSLALVLSFLFKASPKLLVSSVASISILSLLVISKSFPLLFTENFIASQISSYQKNGWNYALFEDEVANTLAYASPGGSKDEKGLIIDGVHTTTLTTQTKLLAHLPLFLHPNPQKMLVVAFGIGTTFRSALTHDIYVDSVELVPSVPKAFTFFHPDAREVLENPKGRIIINDGRNFLSTTKNKYDVIVIDPPPPINASGTTILYSKDFYEDAKKVLKPGGIVTQWFWYGASEDDFKILFASFRQSFPHILIAVSPEGRGVFFIGSGVPLNIDKALISQRYQGKVESDFNEWLSKPFSVANILNLFVGDERTIDRFIEDAKPLTDNFPKTEYFFLRHHVGPRPDISADWVHPIPEDFDIKYAIQRK